MNQQGKIVKNVDIQWSLKWVDMENLWHAAISRIAVIQNQLLKKSVLHVRNVKKGKLLNVKVKRNDFFMDAIRYPECEFVSWDKPISRKCPKCEANC